MGNPAAAQTTDGTLYAYSARVGGRASRCGLALADRSWPLDLRRVFPGEDLHIAASSRAFAKALSALVPDTIILVAPPASPADLRRVAKWIASHVDASAILLTPLQSAVLQLQPLLGDVATLQPTAPQGLDARVVAKDRVVLGGGIEFDRRAGAVVRDGKVLSLRPKEEALLDFLATNPARVWSRRELLRHVWNESAPSVRTVDVHIFWLRAKVERDPADPKVLLTVRGHGYVFDPPPIAPAIPPSDPS